MARVTRVKAPREPKGKTLSEQESAGKSMIYCPVCQQHKHEDIYAHHQTLNYFICSDCGAMFMNPEHVKQLLTQIAKDKKSSIVKP